MAEDERGRGRELTAAIYDEREQEARSHARLIRQMLEGRQVPEASSETRG
jgi:hypothetical protein